MIGGGLLPPVVAVLAMNMTEFSAGADKAEARMKGLSASGSAEMSKLGASVVLAGAGIAAASVKMASDFQTQMTRLYTAAGAPEAAVKGATDQVLALGNSVGYSGTQIAEALYHPVSAGLDLATSLQVVKYAAQEAQISGASLDDTTYSLSSVMKAFNQPASEAATTMAQLNAIVGQGDMHFQDFNTSIKNWAPTAAQMGISVTSMGAALAYLTDRGNSAEEAATRVTMGLTMMATPSKQAAKLLEGLGVASSDVTASTDAMTTVLKKTGITQNELAADLAKPDGIYVALQHLKSSLEQAGVSGTEADSVLSKIFGGGRSDKAILSLMQNLDGLKGKFDDIQTAASPDKFANAWQQTQQTFAYQLKAVGAEVENLAIRFGSMLIPVIQDVVGWFSRNQWAAEALAGVIVTVLVASLVRFSITATTTVLEAVQKIITAFTGMGAAAKTTAVETEAAQAATTSWTASLGRAIPIIGAVVGGAALLGQKLGQIAGVGDHTSVNIDQFTQSLLDAANGSKQAQDQVDQTANQLVYMSDVSGKTVQGLKDIDSSLAQLYSSGNTDAAKKEFDAITKSLKDQGLSAADAASKFPQYAQAIADATTQQKLAAGAAKEAGGAVAGTVDPLNQAANAAQGTADAVTQVTDAFTTLSGNITASGALDAFKKDLLSVTDELKKNGTSLADDTLEGLANREAFRNAADEILKYRDDQIKNGEATDQANQVASQQAAQLIKVWEQLGANKQQVEAYATALGLVPKDLYTPVHLDTGPALNELNGLIQQINDSTGVVQVYASSGNPAGGRAYTYDRGGWVQAPKGAPQLAVVHGGEFVLSNDMLAGSASMPSLPSIPSSGGAPQIALAVDVYVDGAKTRGAVQKQTLRYQLRNSKNGLSLSGIGG
jgi:TP901 family phage tail tape measure protein